MKDVDFSIFATLFNNVTNILTQTCYHEKTFETM